MKHTLAALLILMTMVQPAGCELEDVLRDFTDDFVGSNQAENVQNSFDESFDVIIGDEDGTVEGGLINGGNIFYDGEYTEENKQPENDEKITVGTALEYEKPIVGYIDTENGFAVDKENAGAYGNHTIRVPEIVGAQNAKALNDKIYASVEKYHNDLVNNKEGMNTYNVNYYFAQNEKAISIILEINIGEQMVGGTTFYKGYYYDCEKDAEISFDGYIQKMGYTKESFNSMLLTLKTKYYSITEKEAKNVVDVAISEDKIYLVIENPDAVDAEPYVGLWTFDK